MKALTRICSAYSPHHLQFQGERLCGHPYLHEDLRVTSEGILSITYIILVILFLLSLIILIFFTEMVYLPLRKITEATEQYAAGNMHYEIQVDSEDEMGVSGRHPFLHGE